jgi:hypothetical protein
LPHPSAIDPQVTPCAAQVVGVQVGVMHWFFEQSCVGLHGLPQSRTLPHPSEVIPHARPRVWQVFGVHVEGPHLFGPPPPPHTWPDVQLPQWSTPPQPSGISPQFMLLSGHCVSGVHAGAPHCPRVPPPPQVVPAGQVPQLSVLPQPSPARPQL